MTAAGRVSASTGNVTITVSGPSDKWFGVGFGARLMAESPYAIIVAGNSGAVSSPGTPFVNNGPVAGGYWSYTTSASGK